MNYTDLTLGDLAEIEEITGMPYINMFDNAVTNAKLKQAVIYVLKKKEDPKFTFKDAGNIKASEFEDLFLGSEAPAKKS